MLCSTECPLSHLSPEIRKQRLRAVSHQRKLTQVDPFKMVQNLVVIVLIEKLCHGFVLHSDTGRVWRNLLISGHVVTA